MAGPLSSRRGASRDNNSILCFYNIIRSPALYIGCLALTGVAFHYLSQDPYSNVVPEPIQQERPAYNLRSDATTRSTTTSSIKEEQHTCETEGSQVLPPDLTIDFPKIRSFSNNNAALQKLKGFTHAGYEKFMLSPPGREHYALLNYLSHTFGDCRHVVDIGTRFVASALSMGSNFQTPVWTFDLPSSKERHDAFRGKTEDEWQDELQKVGVTVKFHNLDLIAVSDDEFKRYMNTWFIMLDTAHRPYTKPFEREFFQRLLDMNYRGVLLLDDIDEHDEMRRWWKEVRDGAKDGKYTTYDVSSIGHWSGTGLVDFSGQLKVVGAPALTQDEASTESVEPKLANPDPTLIKLNQTYLSHLRTLAPLPKKVHILFPDRHYDVTHAELPFVQHSIIALKKLNPGWNVTVYDNDDVDEVIRHGGREGILSQEEVDILVGTATNGTEAAHIVERSDIARLILMYTQGGFYLDADRLVSIPMSKIVQENTKLCLPTYDDVNFCQDLQCTSPKNELFLAMIRDCSNIRMKKGPNGGPLERRKGWSRGGALFDMGPVVYNRNILSMVFEGVSYDDIGKHGGYAKARESLVNSDGLILTKNDSPPDGLLLDDTIQKYDRGALYNAYGMRGWASAVDAIWKDER